MEEKLRSDYNIEFAHIYVNEDVTREHFEASWITKQFIEKLEQEKQSYSTVVLIDNYNPTENLLNVDEFLQTVKSHGLIPDYLVYEADLVAYKDQVLGNIQNLRLQKNYTNYINHKNKIPCSFLIVIWHLLRLGVLKIDPAILHPIKQNPAPFLASRLQTILPKRYESVERKAQELIQHSLYKETLEKIDYTFF